MLKKLRVISLILIFAFAVNTFPCYAADTYSADYDGTYYFGSTGERYTTSFYDLLSPLSRIVYDELEANIEKTKSGTEEIVFIVPDEYNLAALPTEETDFYSDAIVAFERDHPEIFWIDFTKLHLNGSSYRGTWTISLNRGSCKNYFIDDFNSAEEVAIACSAFDASVEKIMETVNKQNGKLMKLTAIHEWLIRNNEYCKTTFSGSTFESYSAIIGNLTGSGCPVCEGYSKAFKVLCDKIGVPCVCISGMGFNNGSGENHMWNEVQLDGKWYAVDVTWDDSLTSTSISEDFFLVGSDTVIRGDKFSESHVEDPYIARSFCKFDGPVLSQKAFTSRNTVITGMSNFTRKSTYKDGMFSDVSNNEWYTENIISAYELELMMGYENGTYGVKDNLTIAQTIAIAARINAIYNDVTIDTSYGNTWYAPYVKYCIDKDIIASENYSYDSSATRAEFAAIIGNALPESELEEINSIADGAIPDVGMDETYSANVYRLYRAGILAGNDKAGTFAPDTFILRSQVAAIITRMADPSLRKNISL